MKQTNYSKNFLKNVKTISLFSCITLGILSLSLIANEVLMTPSEICNNALDDDNDKLVDCFDPDCACSEDCATFYYYNCSDSCVAPAPCELDFEIEPFWVSEANPGSYPVLVGGDLDHDDSVEIVTYEVNGNTIFIINGEDGSTQLAFQTAVPLAGGMGLAIANVVNDAHGEILVIGNDGYLYCYDHYGNLQYTSNEPVGTGTGVKFSLINVADFDQNGAPEVNVGNRVFNGQTGELMVAGGSTVSNGTHPFRPQESFNAVVPVDILEDGFCDRCGGLELIAGNQLILVDLDSLDIGAYRTLEGFNDGYTSIADINADGNLDAVVQSSDFIIDVEGDTIYRRIVYAWDVKNEELIHSFTDIDVASVNNMVASRVNVADVDGDGELEFSFCAHSDFIVLDNDFELLWRRQINDWSSATVATTFDFCGDGSSEIVYRDHDTLYIFNGADGNIVWSTVCNSATHSEYPLIMDIDGDGEAELLTTCDPTGSNGKVYAYQSGGNTVWPDTRPVRNQHNFFNTNVNDDLSIPTVQQSPHLVEDGRLNNFMNPYQDPNHPTPDIYIKVNSFNCSGNDSLLLFVEICNLGDRVLSAGVPIAMYIGDPFSSISQAADLKFTQSNLIVGDCDFLQWNIPLITESIFIVANDDQTSNLPLHIDSFPLNNLRECDYNNNIAVFTFQPLLISFETITSCKEPSSGEISLNVEHGNPPYSYNWNPQNINNNHLTDLYTGNYQVTITDLNHCTASIDVFVDEYEDASYTLGLDPVSCYGGSDGSATVETSGVSPFLYYWNNGVTEAYNDNLSAGNYVVTIVDGRNCLQVDSIFIGQPEELFITTDMQAPLCYNGNDGFLNLYEVQGGIAPYAISINGGSIFRLPQLPVTLDELISETYTFEIWDSLNCYRVFEFNLENPEKQELSFPDNYNVKLGDSIQLIPELNFIPSLVQWNAQDGIHCITCEAPFVRPTETSIFNAYMEDGFGCGIRAEVLVKVNNTNGIFIPNVFSPNNDGVNDLFVIHTGRDIKRIRSFIVFNRWGGVCYAKYNFEPNNPLFGWDGKSKGKVQNPGVYVYMIEVEFDDGSLKRIADDITLL